MESSTKKRIIFTFSIFVFLFLVVLGKAFKVQVLDKEKLLTRAKKQFFRERKIYPKRGNIYDRNGEPLAINIQTFSLFTIPGNFAEDKIVYKKLSEIIPSIDYRELVRSVKKRKRFTWIARKIELTKEQEEEIKKLKRIYIEPVPKRIYPNHELFSQALGFVGVDNVGLAGLEYQFNEQLKGEPKILKYVIDNKGRPIKFESSQVGSASQDIRVSIDKGLQAVAEKTLKEAVKTYEALGGGIGVIDVDSGEVLAMANYPTYDPNKLTHETASYRKLSFVTDPIEPGSTFKTFTVASALENNIARADTSYFCEHGRLKVEDHVISEAESRKKYEWLTVEEILKYSSNVGTTKIAFDLTFPRLKETLDSFRLGEKTNIELPGESRGIYTEEKNVSPLSLSNISFGQGVATTGIQMLAAYAAIARGGSYLPPTIIKGGNNDKEGEVVLSPKTAQSLTEMMIKVVDEGTGGNAKIPYFKIAGKTSTAQRADGKGQYSGYIPAFIGYPVNVKKKFVVYVYIEKPEKKNSYYGNTVAAPVFKKIAQHVLYKNKEFEHLALEQREGRAQSFDEVKIKHASTRIINNGVPNFTGLDKRSAGKLAKKLKLRVVHQGIGVVSEQSPLPGADVDGDAVVILKYIPPTYE